MSYGSGVHLTLLCAVLPFPLGFKIPLSTGLSTVSTESFRSLGQNMGQEPRSRLSSGNEALLQAVIVLRY